VDRISVNVNHECDLENPELYVPTVAISQHVKSTSEDGRDGVVMVESNRRISSHADRVLEGIRRQGHRLDLLHPPHCVDYFYGGHAYLGTIIFWRERSKEPISQETLEFIADLEPFLIFALSDLVARNERARPIDGVFNEALTLLNQEAGLTTQEQRVIVLQLLGHSYKEMADILFVSIDTVKKHFKNIHQKTNTKGQAELFAKYFTSRLADKTGTTNES
jgi:DNA-binding CsgD family transcriptional regulator